MPSLRVGACNEFLACVWREDNGRGSSICWLFRSLLFFIITNLLQATFFGRSWEHSCVALSHGADRTHDDLSTRWAAASSDVCSLFFTGQTGPAQHS